MIRTFHEAQCLRGNVEGEDEVICCLCHKGIGYLASVYIVQDIEVVETNLIPSMPHINTVTKTMLAHKRCWDDPKQPNPHEYFGV